MAKEHKWRRSMKRWTLGQLRGMIHVDIVACISMWQICYLCRILCALKCIIMQQFIFDSFAHSFASFCLFRFALCFYFHLGCGIKSRLGKWEYRIETLFRQYLFNPDEQRYGRIKAKKKILGICSVQMMMRTNSRYRYSSSGFTVYSQS